VNLPDPPIAHERITRERTIGCLPLTSCGEARPIRATLLIVEKGGPKDGSGSPAPHRLWTDHEHLHARSDPTNRGAHWNGSSRAWLVEHR
jgi:hypothetical protein